MDFQSTQKTTEDVDNGNSKECRSFDLDLHCNTFKIRFWTAGLRGGACRRDRTRNTQLPNADTSDFFFWSDKKGGSSAPSEPPLATCLAWFTVTMRPGGDWASRCRRSENRSTSRGQAKNFRICLMTTKVVSSTKPLARSVKVQSLTLLTLSCQGITKTTTRSGSAVSPKKKKKKKVGSNKRSDAERI